MNLFPGIIGTNPRKVTRRHKQLGLGYEGIDRFDQRDKDGEMIFKECCQRSFLLALRESHNPGDVVRCRCGTESPPMEFRFF